MDELIGLALQAAARGAAAKRQSAGPSTGTVPAERYQQVLGAMGAREGAASAAVSTVVPAQARPVPVAAAPPAQTTAKVAPGASRAAGLGEMFRDGKSLLRAVIAAEVLGPPRALQESFYWQTSRPNEPLNSPA